MIDNGLDASEVDERVAGPIERTRYVVTIDLSPDEVVRALVDFGPERPEIWRETSHPAVYRVHQVGETDAEVTEGVPFAWSRERYDWSEPGAVTLTQLASNVARNGTIRYEITAEGSGSLVTCTRYREFHGLRGRLAGSLMTIFGARLLKAQFRAGCERWRRRRVGQDERPSGY